MYKMPFLESSAKNSLNVEEAFVTISTDIYKRFNAALQDGVIGATMLDNLDDKEQYMLI